MVKFLRKFIFVGNHKKFLIINYSIMLVIPQKYYFSLIELIFVYPVKMSVLGYATNRKYPLFVKNFEYEK